MLVAVVSVTAYNTNTIMASPVRISSTTEGVKFPLSLGESVVSSTTDFAFGSATACGCDGQSVTEKLATYKWVGVATPNWIGTPYKGTNGATANGADTYESVQGETYYSNCASGEGGCGKCWQLTTTGEENIYGASLSETYTVNVVVMDTCEDANAYGNNYQWCVAAKNIPSTGINTEGYSGHTPPFGDDLRLGEWKVNSTDAVWTQDDCYDEDGTFICTNMAGKALHFDFAIADLDDATVAAMGVWPKGSNPIVSAAPIECPSEVTETLQDGCGANAANPSDINKCIFTCTQDDGATPFIPDYYGGCNNDPSCAPINTQCGGDGWAGPTCCQWGQECHYENEYYSGCKQA